MDADTWILKPSDEGKAADAAQDVRKINYYTCSVKYSGDYVRKRISEAEGNVYFHDIASWGEASMKDTFMKAIRVFSGRK